MGRSPFKYKVPKEQAHGYVAQQNAVDTDGLP
jgi:hypothetical protein